MKNQTTSQAGERTQDECKYFWVCYADAYEDKNMGCAVRAKDATEAGEIVEKSEVDCMGNSQVQFIVEVKEISKEEWEKGPRALDQYDRK